MDPGICDDDFPWKKRGDFSVGFGVVQQFCGEFELDPDLQIFEKHHPAYKNDFSVNPRFFLFFHHPDFAFIHP